MPSSNHDNNHILLSRKIGDPVASAGTNGNVVTSALRNDYLNRANKFIQMFFRGRPDVEVWLQGLIGTGTVTAFSSSGFSISGITDYSYFLTCTKDGATSTKDVVLKYVEPSRKTALDNGLNLNNQDVFTVLGGKLYAYEKGAVLSSGAGKLKYIKTDYKASAAASSDIEIDALWFEPLVEIAALYHSLDKGELDFAAAYKAQRDIILAIVGGGQ